MKRKLNIWTGIVGGFFLNLLVGVLLLVDVPLEFWSYEGHGLLVIGKWKIFHPTLIELYVSGFIHLGGLGGLFGAWRDYEYRKIEALKPLWKLLPLLLGLGIFFGIMGPLYLLALGGVAVVRLLTRLTIISIIGDFGLIGLLSLFGSPMPCFLLFGCLVLGVLIYQLEFTQRGEDVEDTDALGPAEDVSG